MIQITPQMRVLLAVEPVDFRKGIDGLVQVCRHKLQADPPRKLKNLQGIPSIYVVAERSGRNGVPVVAFLKQAGVDAEAFNLKDKGVLGNGHFMMLETNRRQVFDVIRGWIESKVSG